MDKPKRTIEWRSVTGATILVGDRSVTLEALTVVVKLPFGGIAWTRPSAVIVERGGKVERIPIHDVTRIVRATMLALPVALSLVILTRRGTTA
jgi:hypothetical protein